MSAFGKIMKCDDYKQAITADPSESFADGAEHVAACASCAEYKAEMLALDESIAKALAFDVPELQMPDLPELDGNDENVVNMPFKRKSRITMPPWIGIAAGFALAAFLGVQFLATDITESSDKDLLLAAQVLSHLDHEPGALLPTNTVVAEERLAQVINDGVGTMDRNIGLVTYAMSCKINGRTIPHLVIQGEKGPITLLLMPEEMVTMAVPLTGESISGVILPMGSGSIAIIGARGERLDEIQERVVNSVEWSI
jgi:hypothetical protein